MILPHWHLINMCGSDVLWQYHFTLVQKGGKLGKGEVRWVVVRIRRFHQKVGAKNGVYGLAQMTGEQQHSKGPQEGS